MDCTHCESTECYVVQIRRRSSPIYFVHCPHCEAHGPYCNSEKEAKSEWAMNLRMIALGHRYMGEKLVLEG